jgi:hypothetical protein
MDPEAALRAYEQDTNPQDVIRKSISGAYQDLRPELDLVHGYETAQMPTFYNAFSGYGMGTGADDMSPQARLASASRDVARKSATARTARGILDTRRAGMEQLIGDTFNQWNQGYGMAQNQYNRWWQQQQAEEDKRRWEAEMALRSRDTDGGGVVENPYNFGFPGDAAGGDGSGRVPISPAQTRYENYLAQGMDIGLAYQYSMNPSLISKDPQYLPYVTPQIQSAAQSGLMNFLLPGSGVVKDVVQAGGVKDYASGQWKNLMGIFKR